LARVTSGSEKIELAHRLINIDNLRETSHRLLMEAYSEQGEKALALRYYDKIRKLLSNELGVEPSSETRELREKIAANGNSRDHVGEKIGSGHKVTPLSEAKHGNKPILTDGTFDEPMAGLTSGKPRRSIFGSRSILTILTCVVAIAAATWFWYGKYPTAVIEPSVAILPFENLSGDPADQRIADGITADIITELTRFRDFDVIARNSTEIYKNRPVDVREIGNKLNVSYVLEGSYQRQGDRLRINMQLIDTGTGLQVISQRFDNPTEDLFAVQAEVAAKVANYLGGWNGVINLNDLLAAKRKQRTDLNAYALYLLGDEARRGLSEESVLRAVAILKEAIAADPSLARAHTSLAYTYARVMLFETHMGPTIELMQEEARRAVELDPLDARAFASLGFAIGMTGDLKRAEDEYEKALNLSPNSFDILLSYSCWAFAFGKGQAGANAVDRAIRLNPSYPDNGVDCFRYALFMIGRYEDAIRTQRRLPEEKWNPDGFAMTAGSLAALGQLNEAKTLANRGFTKFPSILSVEKFALNREWSPPESTKLVELMQKAGFPVCAKEADLADHLNPIRMPECKTN
jgi:TolB-like protein